MIYINRQETDPFFNIAAEEYILKEFSDDVFMLWQNQPSIIVGKHQNALAEINQKYIQKHQIPVVRRISGGGTVYHDQGNLNFSFIKNGKRNELVNFRAFADIIIQALKSLSINAHFEGKNDLRIDGKKISGNAEHVYKNRVLHHGTLLFSSELNKLNEAIAPDFKNFTDKAVKSNRSEVANISGFLKHPITINEFKEIILKEVMNNDKEAVLYSFTPKDRQKISHYVQTKYSLWSWNYGYSPGYKLNRILEISGLKAKIQLEVKDGIIRDIIFNVENSTNNFELTLKELLIGSRHEPQTIKSRLLSGSLEPVDQTDVATILETLF